MGVQLAAESVQVGVLESTLVCIPRSAQSGGVKPLRLAGYEYKPVVPDMRTLSELGSAALSGIFSYPEDNVLPTTLIELVPNPPEAILDALHNYPTHLIDKRTDRGAPTRQLWAAGTAIGGSFLQITRSQPGLLTTTRNPVSGRLAALHPDNRSGGAYTDERYYSDRRLVVNGGPGDREALFCFPDIVQLSQELTIQTRRLSPYRRDVPYSLPVSLNGSERFRVCVERSMEKIICLRLWIPAGQGYIAPTDAIAHDGSTYRSTEPSLVAQYLGNWGRNEFSANSCEKSNLYTPPGNPGH
jgi:hypothetical protein